MKKSLILILFLLVFISTSLFSHSGRTDATGGHNDRKRGTYHYHNPGSIHAPGNPYQNHDRCGICNQLKNKEDIIIGQTLLKELNYYSGDCNGDMNEPTKEAVKKAQEKYGISKTGYLTTYLLKKLTEERKSL
jgi:Putative peptidoglycan binding domain.